MRSVKLGLVVILLGILGVACKRLNISPLFETKVENSDVNNWIYAKMKEYYLWEDDMIDVTKTDLTLAPDDYFKSLLVEPGVVDRTSNLGAYSSTKSLNLIGRFLSALSFL